MSPRSTVAETDRRRALGRAQDYQRRAARENSAGHAARGLRLAASGWRLLGVADDHQPTTCEPTRCRLATRLLATMAKSTVEIDGVDTALQLMDRSLAWSECLHDQELTALMLSQRGLILFRGGRLAESEATFGAALALMPDDERDAVRVLLNRGALFVETGAITAARNDLTRAARLSRRLRDPQFEHIALHNLGCLEFVAGDLPRALRLMQDALDVDSETLEGLTHLDRARVLLAAGLPEEADAALSEAAELFRRDRCWQDLGEVDLTRAEVALQTERFEDARRLAGLARDRFRRHGNDRWRRSAELVLLDADHAAGRPPARLLPHARRLAAELSAAGSPTRAGAALLAAAELELDLDRPAEAVRLLDQVGRVTTSSPIAVRLRHRLVTARTLEQGDDLRAARRTSALGLRDLAAYQAQFAGVDLRSASAVHGRRLAQQDLDLALRSRSPLAVLASVERSRAVSGRIQPVTPPADDRTAELLAALRRAIDVGDAGGRSTSTLQAELRSRSWLNSGSRTWHPPTAVRRLRAAGAADDCHLVTVAEARGRLLAVRCTPGSSPRLWDLGASEAVLSRQRRLAADLDALADAGLPPALATAVTASLRRTAAALATLLAPAIPSDDRAVVLSPPSRLLALPWSLLPSLAGRPLTVTPSLSGWCRGRRGETDVGWSLAAVAGPGLARSAEEAAAVARTWVGRAETVELPAAAPAELLDLMAGSRVVHVAAHGVHRSENPMFSSLSLSGGPLFAYELDRRGRVPQHVVLSACDAGRATVRAGEETLGLTSVLLQLGTACVVAGVARVHDDVAAAIMQRYHHELAAGRDSAEALSLVNAQAGAPSPFVCFGAPWSA